MQCPACHSMHTIKNGSIPSGKPKWRCKACGRQFVANPGRSRIPSETIALVDRLLLEKISLAGIARAAGVSPRWLQSYVNKTYAAVSRTVTVHPKKRPIDARMRRTLVVCPVQADTTVDLAGLGS